MGSLRAYQAALQELVSSICQPTLLQGPYMGCFQATAASGERLFCVDLNFRIALTEPAGAAAQDVVQ